MLITILILVLVLLPAIRVNAVVGVDDAIIIIAGTILFSCGVKYATDADFRQGAQDFFYSCSDVVRKKIEELSLLCLPVTGTLELSYNFGYDLWKQVTQDVVDYYTIYYDPDGATVTAGSNGHIGFTTDSQFTIHLTNADSNVYYIQNVFLNDMTITLYDKPQGNGSNFDHCFVQPIESDVDYVKEECDIYSSYVVNVSRLSLMFYKLGALTRGDVTCYVYNTFNNTSTGFPLYFSTESSIMSIFSNYCPSKSETRPYCVYDNLYSVDGNVCYLMTCDDGLLRFVTFDSARSSDSDYEYVSMTNSETGKTYDSFNNLAEFLSIVCEASGLDFPAVGNLDVVDGDVYDGVAVPVSSSGSVPDVYDGTSDKTLTIPDSVANADSIADAYSALMETDVSDVISDSVATDTDIEYPDEVPDIDSSGLFEKFPFCIPMDIYNLFTGFYISEAEAPKFTFPFQIIKQDDGTYLIDEEITLDFSILDPVVPLIRWFVTISFTMGLIMITRKVIGAQ